MVEKNEPLLVQLQESLDYRFADQALLLRCLTHVSQGHREDEGHNETLEFLGDAVLNLAISDLLMRRFPDKKEGDLSKMRAGLVNTKILAKKAEDLGLDKLIRMAKGEERSGGRRKESILAAALEAVLGGIYWEGGYQEAIRVVESHFSSDMKQRRLGLQDYKTRLQEISQMLFHSPPTYRLAAESGPNHEKRFVTEIVLGGTILGRGEGSSKKTSEQEAARQALKELRERGA